MVDRCVCHDVTFAELHALAQRARCGLSGLVIRTGCTTGCGSCRPYILLMLQTGQVVFPILTPAQIRAAERSADGDTHAAAVPANQTTQARPEDGAV